MIIASAQRRAAALHKARLTIEEGRSELEALDTGFPRLHFSRKTLVETALRNTSAERMIRAMTQLADAAFDMRKQSSLAEVIAQRALLAIAVNARRRG